MDSSLIVSSSSLEALIDDYRTIAANLANANTVGYKSRRNAFVEALLEAGFDPFEPPSPVTLDSGGIDFRQGPVVATGRPLDLAVQGDGFFVIETPDGPLFTRNGIFLLNKDRQLVNAAGNIVSGESGPITMPPDVALIAVSRTGRVSAGGKSIGALRVVEFDDETRLAPVGNSAFTHLDGDAGRPAVRFEVLQGFRESSNVQTANELVDLVSVMRLYELNLKAIQSTDERQKEIIQLAMA